MAKSKPPERKPIAHLVLRDPVGALVVALLVAFVLGSLAASGVITMTLAVILLALAWITGAFGFGFGLVEPLSGLRRKHKLISMLVLGAILGLIGWFESVHQPLLQATAKNIGLTRGPRPKLADLFKSDFPTYFGLAKNVSFDVHGVPKVTFRASEYADFTANSLFVGFYIPSSPYTFQICVDLTDRIQEFIKQENSTIRMYTKSAGEPSPTNLKGLRFTGRVFIYDEDALSLQQMAYLTNLYTSKGMLVQFRGPDYVTMRWLGEPEKLTRKTASK